MKLLPKVLVVAMTFGAGATMYAAPGGWLSPNGTGGAASLSASASFEEMLSRSQTLKAQMTADFQHVQHLQLIARREKDVIKLNCVNDKLVEMKPQMNLADHGINELQGAQSAGDQRAAFDGVAQASDQVRGLREAAEQCIGEHLL